MMLLKIAVIVLALMVTLSVIASAFDGRKRKIRRIVPAHRDRNIIGDGAWLNPDSPAPRSARVRDIEPRGA